jgi:hypothetical protein
MGERAMRSRANGWTITVAAAALLCCLAGTAPAAAGNSEFYVKFDNQSGALLRVGIIYSGKYQVQKDAQISPNKSHTFQFGVKCTNTHSRRFAIWELVGDTTQIASGQFTMETGKSMGEFKVECRNPTLTKDSCDDSVVNDDFSVKCEAEGAGLTVTID